MDSFGNTLLSEGQTFLLGDWGRTFTILSPGPDSGLKFNAIPFRESVIDPGMPLGADIREATYLELNRNLVPSSFMAPGAASQIRIGVDGYVLIITKREDNFSTPFVRFDIVNSPPGLDT